MNNIIQHSLISTYLDLARSFSSENLILKSKEYVNQGGDINKAANYAFGLLSGACIYSILAVESFANYRLTEIRTKADKSLIKKLKLKFPDEEFIEKEKLKEKLKYICKFYNISSISEEIFWIDFINVLRDKRNFFTHPKAYSNEFEKFIENIFNKIAPDKYTDTAIKIISYYYEKLDKVKPKYLEGNNFYIKEMVIL